MRLELLTPPELVAVEEAGVVSPALLLARRADRRYVQVSRGPGLNHLRWVDDALLRPATEATRVDLPVVGSAPVGGLPRHQR